VARIGLLPHADLPHVIPFLRLGREISKLGHQVRLVGSDVLTIGRPHSQVWRDALANYGLADCVVLHRDAQVRFHSWLRRVIAEEQLDVLMIDAVWQALSYDLADLPRTTVVVHHAGLPDFRTEDMPTWYFVHPGHPRGLLIAARRRNEELERLGRGVRGVLSSLKSGADTSFGSQFAFGCGEFEKLPAIRAMSLCPAAEFPSERGRVEYLGTSLPGPEDMDWRAPPPVLMQPSRPLIACVFGTTGLRTRDEYRWLFECAGNLAEEFTDSQVVTVIPEGMQAELKIQNLRPNLLVFSWIPLWELLMTRTGAKVIVTTPGLGAFREAIASATPLVAIPRTLDQFGAAARVEYFGLGFAWVSNELPSSQVLAQHVANALRDDGTRLQSARMAEEVRAFDRTRPLQRFIDEVSATKHQG
jgi:hypothetical protein